MEKLTKFFKKCYNSFIAVTGYIVIACDKVKDESATFESLVNGLAVRDFPSTKSELSHRVAELNKGDRVSYDSVYNCDGKRWVSYIGFSGNRRYVCLRDYKNGDVYGYAY